MMGRTWTGLYSGSIAKNDYKNDYKKGGAE